MNANMYKELLVLPEIREELLSEADSHRFLPDVAGEYVRMLSEEGEEIKRIHCLSCQTEFEVPEHDSRSTCPHCGAEFHGSQNIPVSTPMPIQPQWLNELLEERDDNNDDDLEYMSENHRDSSRFRVLAITDYDPVAETLNLLVCSGEFTAVTSLDADTFTRLAAEKDPKCWMRDKLDLRLSVTGEIAVTPHRMNLLVRSDSGNTTEISLDDLISGTHPFWPRVFGNRDLLMLLHRHHYPVYEGPEEILRYLSEHARNNINPPIRKMPIRWPKPFLQEQQRLAKMMKDWILSADEAELNVEDSDTGRALVPELTEDGTAILHLLVRKKDKSLHRLMLGLSEQAYCLLRVSADGSKVTLMSDLSALNSRIVANHQFAVSEQTMKVLESSSAAWLRLSENTLHSILQDHCEILQALYQMPALAELKEHGWVRWPEDMARWYGIALQHNDKGTDPAHLIGMSSKLYPMIERSDLTKRGHWKEYLELPGELSVVAELFDVETKADAKWLLDNLHPHARIVGTRVSQCIEACRKQGLSLPLMPVSACREYLEKQMELYPEEIHYPLLSYVCYLRRNIRFGMNVEPDEIRFPVRLSAASGSAEILTKVISAYAYTVYPQLLDLPVRNLKGIRIEPHCDPHAFAEDVLRLRIPLHGHHCATRAAMDGIVLRLMRNGHVEALGFVKAVNDGCEAVALLKEDGEDADGDLRQAFESYMRRCKIDPGLEWLESDSRNFTQSARCRLHRSLR